METQEKERLVRLAAGNTELSELLNRHRSFESRLEEMNRRPYLSPEDDVERKKIQKAKLAVKDKIQEFLDKLPN